MSNLADHYAHHARRVALLMAWLGRGLEAHEARSRRVEKAGSLWPMVRDLEHTEELLKVALRFVCPITADEIEQALSEGGRGDE